MTGRISEHSRAILIRGLKVTQTCSVSALAFSLLISIYLGSLGLSCGTLDLQSSLQRMGCAHWVLAAARSIFSLPCSVWVVQLQRSGMHTLSCDAGSSRPGLEVGPPALASQKQVGSQG